MKHATPQETARFFKGTHPIYRRPAVKQPAKVYYIQYNVGTVKYLVNHHDGVKTHPDGSKFYDVSLFSNKSKLQEFLDGLTLAGYIERSLS